MADKQYRAWSSLNESFLFPPSPRDWLPKDHLVYFILDVVELLDLSAIESVLQAKDPRGERPYNPAMMVALLVYAYSVGVFSSRKIAVATYEQVAFRVLTGEQHPHFTRIAAFRKTHLSAFSDLFKQVLLLCRQAGLVKLGHVAVDGSKIQANASKHKAMSYAYMQELERRLESEISSLLSRATAADTAEDEQFGEGEEQQDLPAELKRRTDRLAKLRVAKAALEAEARKARAQHLLELAAGCDERAAADEENRSLNETLAIKHRKQAAELSSPSDDDADDPPFQTPDGLPKHRPNTTADGSPDPKAQRNFTDPESRIMERGGAFGQDYNCQAAVDDTAQIVVAASVTNQSPDAGNLVPMVRLIVANCGRPPAATTADTGYWAPSVEPECAALGTAAYVATERRKHWDKDQTNTSGSPPEDADPKTLMRHKVRTATGRAIYALRKSTVEPVFGQIKEVRGFRRFSMRGLHAAQHEWLFLCATHNLLKLFRAGIARLSNPRQRGIAAA